MHNEQNFSDEQFFKGFEGKNILITGCSGFLGKVVLEKLLRAIPGWNQVYLLLRGNKSYPSPFQRFQREILTSTIFDRLRNERPGHLKNRIENSIHILEGDITRPLLGLSETDFADLANRVDLIINSAASVDFREPLDSALQINALSLKTIAGLANVKGIPVVHVSTCYVNGFNGGIIREEIAPPAKAQLPLLADGRFDVTALMEKLSSSAAKINAREEAEPERYQQQIKLGLDQAKRHGWNDTYTFTKWLGEQILLQEMREGTVTLLRPSIIESTLRSPVPGWIEGVKVADAIILAYAREKISLFPGNKHAVLDIIPADLVANGILLSAAEALSSPGQHRIYQCCSSTSNPIKLKEMIAHVHAEASENHEQHPNLFPKRPQKSFVMIPGFIFNSIMLLAQLMIKIQNRAMSRMGNPPSTKLLKNIETAITLSTVFSFYTHPFYVFSNEKLLALGRRMGAEGSKEFSVCATTFDWGHYLCKVHLAGLNRYALKPRAVKPVLRAHKPVTESA